MFRRTLLELARLSGVTGVIVLWLGVTYAMRQAGLGLVDTRPISYLGVNPNTSQLFSYTLILSAILFITFALYTKRTLHIENRFLFYFLCGQAGQIIAALAPYGNESSYRLIHTIAAFTLAFSLPLLMQQFVSSQSANPARGLYVKLLRFEQFAFIIGISLFIFTKGLAPLGEALPAIGFHLWIFVVTAMSYTAKGGHYEEP